MKNPVSQIYTVTAAKICEVGQSMGHDYNDICDMINDVQLYGCDGDGYCTVNRAYIEHVGPKGHNSSRIIRDILHWIFNENPKMETLYIFD